tara:strand:- start:432 stop:1289 length:858 start_codon:yes stop_codon:yes gene_type:complete
MDDNDFNVYPLKQDPKEKPDRDLPSIFPTGSFNTLIVGSSQTGKTINATSMLCRENMYGCHKGKDYFKNIIIISSTLGSDESIEPIKEKATATYDFYDDSIVKDIIGYCKQHKDSGSKDRTLILADDIISIVPQNSAINKAFSNCRHWNISIMAILQGIRGTISPIARANTHFWVCYRLHSQKERIKLFEELSFLDSEKEVELMYNHCTAQPYNFMVVNAKNLEVSHNFTTPLWSRYNPDGTYAPSFSSQRESKESEDSVLTDVSNDNNLNNEKNNEEIKSDINI